MLHVFVFRSTAGVREHRCHSHAPQCQFFSAHRRAQKHEEWGWAGGRGGVRSAVCSAATALPDVLHAAQHIPLTEPLQHERVPSQPLHTSVPQQPVLPTAAHAQPQLQHSYRAPELQSQRRSDDTRSYQAQTENILITLKAITYWYWLLQSLCFDIKAVWWNRSLIGAILCLETKLKLNSLGDL